MQKETINKTARFFMSCMVIFLLIGYNQNTQATIIQQNDVQDSQSFSEFKGIVIGFNGQFVQIIRFVAISQVIEDLL